MPLINMRSISCIKIKICSRGSSSLLALSPQCVLLVAHNQRGSRTESYCMDTFSLPLVDLISVVKAKLVRQKVYLAHSSFLSDCNQS